MTVAISCFLYYFVLLVILSKIVVQGERKITPLRRRGHRSARLRLQRYGESFIPASVSTKKLQKTFSALTKVKTLARVHYYIFIFYSLVV